MLSSLMFVILISLASERVSRGIAGGGAYSFVACLASHLRRSTERHCGERTSGNSLPRYMHALIQAIFADSKVAGAKGRSTAQQHSTAQHSTAQHSTAQHSTAQHSTAQHSTAQRSAAQRSQAQPSTAQHSAAQHRTAHHRFVTRWRGFACCSTSSSNRRANKHRICTATPLLVYLYKSPQSSTCSRHGASSIIKAL